MPDTYIVAPVLDLSFKGNLDNLVKERNIADSMSQDDLTKIGLWARQGFEDDKTSRSKWDSWYAEAIKLALQIKEAKTFPWPGCANVKFPLLTIACLNAHAQAYPALIPGDRIVKCKPIGQSTPDKEARSDRVGRHMSYQLLECSSWEEQTDKQLLIHYLMGTSFKKVDRDNTRRENFSDFVMPQDLYVNYWARDLESAPRISHRFPLTRNEITENINAQIYLAPSEPIPAVEPATGPLDTAKDKAQLTSRPPELGLVNYTIEQCCWLDLDQDGYDEPYTVTFDEASGYVYRILARYYASGIKRSPKGSVLRIEAECYYVKFILIPSLDGGFYGMGLGRFLAPINDAVDTIINQMLDHTTMKMLGGGWLGRGVRQKLGEASFKPYEWKPIDTPGDDIRKVIMPLETGDVPTAAFDLLKYLVEYGERIGSSGDIQMGKLPGQNTKAETASIANENGKLIFNATYKRFWRAMKQEFRKLYRLNGLYPDDHQYQVGTKDFGIQKGDYDERDSGILPFADPNIISKSDRRAAALLVFETGAKMGWAGHDQDKVIQRLYTANDVPDIESIYIGIEKKPAPPHPKMLEVQAKMQKEKTNALKVQQAGQVAIGKLMIQAKESNAKIYKLGAETMKLMAEAQGVETEHKIQLLQTMIKAEEERRDDVLQIVDMLMSGMKGANDNDQSGDVGGVGGASSDQGTPSPSPA